MKTTTIFRTLASVCICSFFCLTAFAQSSDLKGKWNYKSSEAPYGYDSGTIQFKTNEKGELSAVLFMNAGTVVIEKIEKKDGKYVCSPFMVEGETVTVTLVPEEGKLKATAMAGYDVIRAEMTPKTE